MKQRTWITAHSGCEGTPENSMASIEAGIALGADCVEIDVRLGSGGTLWLAHDLPADLSGLVPLKDAFQLIRAGGVAVNCDLKEEDALLPALRLAENRGLCPEKLIFTGSVAPKLLKERPDVVRRSRVFLNSEVLARYVCPGEKLDRAGQTAFFLNDPERTAKSLHALGVEAMNMPYQYAPPRLIAEMRSRGIALSLWTIDDEDALRALMGEGLTNITTRCVTKALKAREAAG